MAALERIVLGHWRASGRTTAILLLLLLAMAAMVGPVNAADIVLFNQNYSTIGAMPTNIVSNNPVLPVVTDEAYYSAANGTVEIQNTAGEANMLFIGGFTPAPVTNYSIKIDYPFSNQNSEIYLTGAHWRVTLNKRSTGGLRTTVWYTAPNETSLVYNFTTVAPGVVTYPVTLMVAVNTTNRTYTVTYEGVPTSTYSITSPLASGDQYLPYTVLNTGVFTVHPYAATGDVVTIKLYKINQTVPSKGNVTVIGDRTSLSFGWDGPHYWNTTHNGTELITGSGGKDTFWTSVTTIDDPATVNLVKAKIANGSEYGVHFSESFIASGMNYSAINASVDREIDLLSTVYGVSDPGSWVSLKGSENWTHAQYPFRRNGTIWRGGKMGTGQFSTVGNLQNRTWNWTRRAIAANLNIRYFTHETDKTPAITSSIDWDKFQEFVSGYAANGTYIVPFIEWYKRSMNTKDAIITGNTFQPGDRANFSIVTNGYPALVEVAIPYSSSLRAVNISGGAAPTLSQAADGNTLMYVSNATYAIGDGGLLAQFTPAGIVSVLYPGSTAFSDTSTGSPTSFEWQFNETAGNNTWVTFSSLQNPTFSAGPGNYSIRLNASTSSSFNISTQLTIVNVTMPSLMAAFSSNATSGAYPLSVNFTDEGIGYPTSWLWDFGDGSNSTSQNISHIYGGCNQTFTVNLTVTNSTLGISDSEVKTGYIHTSNCTSWCGSIQDLYFQNRTYYDRYGYQELGNIPNGENETDISITLKDSDGDVPMIAFLSPPGLPDADKVLAGLRTFYLYAYVDKATGVTTINSTVFRVFPNGTEADLYSKSTLDIKALSTTEYDTSYVSSSDLPLSRPDERIGVKFSGSTTSSAEVNLHLVYQGTTNVSHVVTGYFYCNPITPAPTPTTIPNLPYRKDPDAQLPWWVYAAGVVALWVVVGVMWRRR